MAKLTMEHFEAEGKWEPEKWIIDNDPLMNKNPVTDFIIEKETDGRLSLTIGLDAEHYRNDPAALRQTVTDLLDGNNISGYKIEQSSHRNLSSIKLRNVTPGDLTRVAGALSASVDKGNGSTAYNLIDPKTALQVADLEIEALGPTGAYSLDSVKATEGEIDYLDYESNIPGAAVKSIQQDGLSAEIDGKYVKQEITGIAFEAGNKSDIVAALEKGGLSFTAGKEIIRCEEPFAKVSQVLANAGLIPKAANTDIQTKLASMKQNFVTAAAVKAAGIAVAKPAPALSGVDPA